MPIINKLKEYRFILVSLVLLLISCCLHPVFATNDDPFFIYAFSGTHYFHGHPFANTIHITKLIGYVMVGLYSTFSKSGIEWYTWYLYLVIFIATYAVNKTLFSQYKQVHPFFPEWAHIVVFNLVFLMPFFVMLQFTMVTVLGATAAFVLFKFGNRKDFILALVLIVLATLLRYKLVPIVLAVLAGSDFLLSNLKKKWLKDYFIGFCGLLILSLVIIGVNSKTFTSQEKQFAGFTKFASEIADNGASPSWYINNTNNKAAFPDWDDTERNLMANFFFSDSVFYSHQKNYNDLIVPNKLGHVDYKGRLKIFFGDMMTIVKSFTWLRILIVAAIFCFCFDRKAIARLVLANVLFGGLMALITVFLRKPPFHLEFPLIIAFNVLFIFTLQLNSKSTLPGALSPKTYFGGLALLSGLLIAFSALNYVKVRKMNEPYGANVNLQQLRSDNLVYITEPWFETPGKSVFSKSTQSLNNISTWSIWFNYPSMSNRVINNVKINNLTNSLTDNKEQVRLLLSDSYAEDFIKIYRSFMSKHYHIQVSIVREKEFESGSSIYKLVL